MGFDRDEDGARDADERDAGTNPGDPLDFPGGPVLTVLESGKLDLKEKVIADGVQRKLTVKLRSNAIVPPLPGSAGDPTLGGAALRIYNASGSGEQWTVGLPAEGWERTASGYRFCPKGTGGCVNVRARNLRVKLKGTYLEYSLDERRQGRLAVRLTLGSGVQWCAESGARIDTAGRFKGARATGPVGPCPVAPAG
jgi:hypothetical protein